MIYRLFIPGIIFLMLNASVFSQQRITVDEYIGQYKDLAIAEMEKHHIPASITLAQGILESESGNSPLAVKANNHFGIKCHKEWTGKTFHQDDEEKNECFRKYQEPEESYRDHSAFLTTRDRYKFLFDLGKTDYKAWAYGLKQAGYATNPRYPELLIRIIEENELFQYDEAGSRHSLVKTQNSKPETQNSELKTQNSKLKTQNSKLKTQNSELLGLGGNNRILFINNGIKFILAREGDTFFGIAAEFGIYSWQIMVYNDMEKQDQLIAGQKVYLEKKKGKAENKMHIVQPGEDLQSISQDYGIRLKALCKLNQKMPGDRIAVGDRLKLR